MRRPCGAVLSMVLRPSVCTDMAQFLVSKACGPTGTRKYTLTRPGRAPDRIRDKSHSSQRSLEHRLLAALVFEGALPSKHHGNLRLGLVAGHNHFRIAHGAAGLGNGRNALGHSYVHPVTEGEESVRNKR